MRIAYVINSVEGGGAAFPVPAIVAALEKAGARVTVLALARRDGRALPAIEAAGIPVRVRDGGRGDHLAAWRWLAREVDALAPDLVWTSLSRATILGQRVAAARGIPVASWQHAAYLKPANRWLMRRQQRLARLWVADSAAVAAFVHETLGVEAGRIVSWPIFRADPAAPVAPRWRPGEPVRIASIGRLHPVKQYPRLVEALARLPAGLDWRLAIGGEGEERAAIAAAVARHGLGERVTLPGFVAAGALLGDAHLYVQPSRSEGFCVAAHEAMLAGLPVVASAVGELAHSIDDDVGRSVPPLDTGALAAALHAMVGEPARLGALGEAARARVLARYDAAAFDARGAAILARLGG